MFYKWILYLLFHNSFIPQIPDNAKKKYNFFIFSGSLFFVIFCKEYGIYSADLNSKFQILNFIKKNFTE